MEAFEMFALIMIAFALAGLLAAVFALVVLALFLWAVSAAAKALE